MAMQVVLTVPSFGPRDLVAPCSPIRRRCFHDNWQQIRMEEAFQPAWRNDMVWRAMNHAKRPSKYLKRRERNYPLVGPTIRCWCAHTASYPHLYPFTRQNELITIKPMWPRWKFAPASVAAASQPLSCAIHFFFPSMENDQVGKTARDKGRCKTARSKNAPKIDERIESMARL